MTMAMPEVKPVITGMGMMDTRRPTFSRAITSSITPDRRPAVSTPCRPYRADRVMRMAAMAPVGPLIW